LRPDAWVMGALATAQWVSLISIALGVAGVLWNHRKHAPEPAPVGGTVVVK